MCVSTFDRNVLVKANNDTKIKLDRSWTRSAIFDSPQMRIRQTLPYYANISRLHI